MNNLVVIGAGPAGEACARFASKKNLEVLLVEKEFVGGLCLNRGCIPSKTLLSFGKKLRDLKGASILDHFYGPGQPSLADSFWKKMQKKKKEVVLALRTNLEKLVKSSGVNVAYGECKFVSPQEISMTGGGKTEKVAFSAAVIAVGSQSLFPPPLDSVRGRTGILDSDGVLDLEDLPASLLVIGGGAVGCEFACLFHELGSRVTIVEKMENLLPGEDTAVSGALRKSFEDRGIKIFTGSIVEKIQPGESQGWAVQLSGGNTVSAEKVLVCAGRGPQVKGLDLEKAGVKYSQKGIEVDSHLRTSNSRLYAVGDVNGLSPLAHAGSVQGEIAAANILGEDVTYDGSLVPRCLYTWPEVASVGMWKNDAEGKGIKAKAQRFFFAGSGRALAEGDTEGFIQILSDLDSDALLGAQIIGPHATEMIHILSVALKKKMTRRELKEVVFAHPTLSEGIRLALER